MVINTLLSMHIFIKKDVNLIKNKKIKCKEAYLYGARYVGFDCNSERRKTPMTTYDRNRNAITIGSRVMVSGTGHTGKILSIDTEGLTAEEIRRGKTAVVEGCEEKLSPMDLIRLGMN
ncbi:conserved hypothetical protein [Escherichia fergusonii ATCC 35469]|uniref:Selenium-binding protein YdfZ n=2 Tax=Escherichia fergusonii TaxID=564 RepID=B7LRB1_ESCF3|nr:conserved hypothetical protein [Escherichia fergusonii ATCC 35469]